MECNLSVACSFFFFFFWLVSRFSDPAWFSVLGAAVERGGFEPQGELVRPTKSYCTIV